MSTKSQGGGLRPRGRVEHPRGSSSASRSRVQGADGGSSSMGETLDLGCVLEGGAVGERRSGLGVF
ncbi:hypothetical protein [Rubrivirga sp.]|uniref:hypothetical protein n=1 Tax=Rubrivirga sp. TaxID=1885344 RepID=UPI003C712067